jgi:16S rRNA (uracil1498-N3)-methyltransferase
MSSVRGQRPMGDARIHHRRFFVPPERIHEGWVEFTPPQAHQLARVLRLRQGDRVSAFDATGREVVASLVTVNSRRAMARILSELPPLPSARLRLTLAQVVIRGPAMDRIVGKATELGVMRVVPLHGERSVRHALPGEFANRDRAASFGRTERWLRWRRIVQEAAEQCGRRDLPEIAPPMRLEDFLSHRPEEAPLLACHHGEGARPVPAVCQALPPVSALTLLVGAEGGLSPGEVEALRAHGAHLVSLGPRLLRADTAALAVLAVIQASLGDWNLERRTVHQATEASA